MAVTQPSRRGRVVRPSWRAAWHTAWPPIAVLALAIAAWEVAVRIFRVPTGLLPAPSRVVSTLVSRQDVFADNLATTLSEIALGFVFGFAAGIVVAILVVYSSPIRRALYPIVIVSQTIPVVALAPLLVIILGFGIASKVVIVALGVFFPLALNVIAGLRSADPNHVRMLRSFSASRLQIFRMVEVPAAMPFLMTGVQIGLTYSVTGAVVAEWPGAERGIGILMVTQYALSRTDMVLAAVVIVTVMAMLMFSLPRLVRRWLIPWERTG
jgi:ABC-type nitrate/sulfonate/bicarbonate transport system permease component